MEYPEGSTRSKLFRVRQRQTEQNRGRLIPQSSVFVFHYFHCQISIPGSISGPKIDSMQSFGNGSLPSKHGRPLRMSVHACFHTCILNQSEPTEAGTRKAIRTPLTSPSLESRHFLAHGSIRLNSGLSHNSVFGSTVWLNLHQSWAKESFASAFKSSVPGAAK